MGEYELQGMNTKRSLLFICLLSLVLLLRGVGQAQFAFTNNGEEITITGYTGSGGSVVIPDAINDYPVTSIGADAFAYCTNLTGVVISTNVTSLGIESFRNCINLTNVIIPNGVTTIGGGAFAWCASLGSVTIPGSVTYIDRFAFYFCTSLTEVHFQGNAPGVYSDPFFGAPNEFAEDSATAFFLPGTTGWDTNFAGLPVWSSYFATNDGTITVSGYAGLGGAVTVPSTVYGLPVARIGTNTFAGNGSVTSVTIPGSVTNIEDGAFEFCTNLTTLYFQGSPPGVGQSVFDGSTNAIVFFLPDVPGWGSAFDGLTAWELYPFSYTTTNGAITITGYTGNRAAVVIPGAVTGLPVTGIAIDAFAYNTGLTSVTIPGSVTNLGSVAFQWCTNLKGAYFEGNALSVAYSDAFDHDTNVVVYYLPGTTGWGTTFEGHPAVPWLPQTQAAAASFGSGPKQFGFNIQWARGQTVVVEACTNFLNPNWQPVQTNTLTTGSVYFCDPQCTNYPGRYYRLRSQ
jgi:hypothetical protein